MLSQSRRLRATIKELRDAKRYIRRNRFEKAEEELVESLKLIGKALRNIIRQERKKQK